MVSILAGIHRVFTLLAIVLNIGVAVLILITVNFYMPMYRKVLEAPWQAWGLLGVNVFCFVVELFFLCWVLANKYSLRPLFCELLLTKIQQQESLFNIVAFLLLIAGNIFYMGMRFRPTHYYFDYYGERIGLWICEHEWRNVYYFDRENTRWEMDLFCVGSAVTGILTCVGAALYLTAAFFGITAYARRTA